MCFLGDLTPVWNFSANRCRLVRAEHFFWKNSAVVSKIVENRVCSAAFLVRVKFALQHAGVFLGFEQTSMPQTLVNPNPWLSKRKKNKPHVHVWKGRISWSSWQVRFHSDILRSSRSSLRKSCWKHEIRHHADRQMNTNLFKKDWRQVFGFSTFTGQISFESAQANNATNHSSANRSPVAADFCKTVLCQQMKLLMTLQTPQTRISSHCWAGNQRRSLEPFMAIEPAHFKDWIQTSFVPNEMLPQFSANMFCCVSPTMAMADFSSTRGGGNLAPIVRQCEKSACVRVHVSRMSSATPNPAPWASHTRFSPQDPLFIDLLSWGPRRSSCLLHEIVVPMVHFCRKCFRCVCLHVDLSVPPSSRDSLQRFCARTRSFCAVFLTNPCWFFPGTLNPMKPSFWNSWGRNLRSTELWPDLSEMLLTTLRCTTDWDWYKLEWMRQAIL